MDLSRRELENLKGLAKLRIEEIASLFVKDFVVSDKLLVSSCPIHEGDNSSAFNINIDPDSEFCGKWFCNTNHCHRDYPNDVIGFVQAMIEKKDGECHFGDALEFVRKFVGATPDDLQKDLASLDTITKFFTRKRKSKGNRLTRGDISRKPWTGLTWGSALPRDRRCTIALFSQSTTRTTNTWSDAWVEM